MTIVLASVLGAAVGVIGGVIGALLTNRFQRQHAERADERAKLERLRQDRMAIYSEFAGAIIEFRRAQLGKRFEPEDKTKSDEARAKRSQAVHQYFRVRLIAHNEGIVDKAKAALDMARSLTKTPDTDRALADADRVRDKLVPEFVDAASHQLGVSASGTEPPRGAGEPNAPRL